MSGWQDSHFGPQISHASSVCSPHSVHRSDSSTDSSSSSSADSSGATAASLAGQKFKGLHANGEQPPPSPVLEQHHSLRGAVDTVRAARAFPRHDEYRKTFDLFDMDQDGKVSLNEVGAIMRVLSHTLGWTDPVTDGEMELMVSQVDTNGDGVIHFDEFCQMMHNLENGKSRLGVIASLEYSLFLAAKPRVGAVLPPGWQQFDHAGIPYYVNKLEGTTQWDFPVDLRTLRRAASAAWAHASFGHIDDVADVFHNPLNGLQLVPDIEASPRPAADHQRSRIYHRIHHTQL